MAGAKKEKKHIVVFQDEEGNVLKTSFVLHKEAALSPEMPEKRGESAHHEIKFQGWDKDISCVQENLVVKAVYKEVPKEYLVMYFHENGKMLGTETVLYGQAAMQPYQPQKPQTAEHYYIFKGWNNDLSCIEKDTMAKAVFEERERSFTVRFFHEDGTLLKEEEVLYGKKAHAPESPKKQSDKIWHYIFDGWDSAFDSIKENREVYAVFSSIYNEYKVCIYEEQLDVVLLEQESGQQAKQQEKQEEQEEGYTGESLKEPLKERLSEERIYHYADVIEYPKLKKKGYTLKWDTHPETVTKNEEIHASWEFSNPAGRIFEVAGSRYQILNPSITNGSVRLLHYAEISGQVHVPEKVKIGDYYYFIEKVASRAFDGCGRMRMLTLPDCVRVLEDEALSCCKRLEKITLGKSCNSRLHVVGRKAFGKNEHLREIYLKGKNLQKVYPDTFGQIKKDLEIYVRPEEIEKMNKLFQKGIQTGKLQIKSSSRI